MSGPERVQKAIARTGFASRRKAELLISDGRVSVDGVVVRLGDRVDPERQKVLIDGVPLPVRPGLVYYLLNKPAGVVSSVSDPQKRTVVTDLVPPDTRVWPVGRLDVDSEGLIILTNDGDLTQLLTHPRHGVRKHYRVLVDGLPSSSQVQALKDGIELDDGFAAAVEARVLERGRDRTLLELVMQEGRKREIRRMCEAVGFGVVHLFRSAIGPVADAGLRSGDWREVTADEVHELYEAAGPGRHTGAMDHTWVVAIDGPGGAGKTTVGRRVAETLGVAHLDTGSFYRAATLITLRAGVVPTSPEALSAVNAGRIDHDQGRTWLDGEDVTDAVRGEDVTAAVSEVSAVPEIRRVMVERQRNWVTEHGGRAVVEGRDIGTVVFPQARLKVFMTATAEVRAARRALQQPELGRVASDLERRDRQDSSREVAPLVAAPDAVHLDTSALSFEEVVEDVLSLAEHRGF